MKMVRKLTFSQKAPDLVVHNTSGEPLQLSSLWAHKPLLLAFTRHFGCTQCKEMVSELAAGKDLIEKAGLEVAVITQGTPASAAVFAGQYAPTLHVLADPDREVYRAYGLERGNLFQTFINTKVWSAISRARKKGYKVEQAPEGQDAMQMSGVFIINPDGKIALPYYYDNIADHPTLDLLLNGVLSTRWSAAFEGPIGPGTEKLVRKTGRGQ